MGTQRKPRLTRGKFVPQPEPLVNSQHRTAAEPNTRAFVRSNVNDGKPPLPTHLRHFEQPSIFNGELTITIRPSTDKPSPAIRTSRRNGRCVTICYLNGIPYYTNASKPRP